MRYAWAANPEGANLVNSAGLPASVFRTDTWDDVEVKVDGAAQEALQHRRALAIEIKALAARRPNWIAAATNSKRSRNGRESCRKSSKH